MISSEECANCGKSAVRGSTLCVDCLAAAKTDYKKREKMSKEKIRLDLDADCRNCGQPAVIGSDLCGVCLQKERLKWAKKYKQPKQDTKSLIESLRAANYEKQRFMENLLNEVYEQNKKIVRLEQENKKLLEDKHTVIF